jgi:predicted amidophosphoribosyltransferase
LLAYKELFIINPYEGVDFGVRCFTPSLQTNIPANTKLCEVCGERFEYNTNSCKPTLYCKKCAERIKTEKDKARIKQNRLIKK